MMDPDVRRILLVGFMGSGKSSVGRTLARTLGWRFHDFDGRVEARDGRPVRRIFAESGEARFRELEAEVARDLLALDRVVLASGGGWAAVPGRLRDLPPGTRSVWLRVSPETAVERATRRPGLRPLLDVADPLATARGLLSERSSRYAECHMEVDTDGRTVEDVASRILDLLGRSAAETEAAEKG